MVQEDADRPSGTAQARAASATSDGAQVVENDQQGKRAVSKHKSPADVLRGKLTMMDVLRGQDGLKPFQAGYLLVATVVMVAYGFKALPAIASFGESRWRSSVAAGAAEARPGGPYAEVSWEYLLLLSLSYVAIMLLGARTMARRRAPVGSFIFECMAVHNLAQCLLNFYCAVSLFAEARALNLGAWGNDFDPSPRSEKLGSFIWLQYHCRQLQLLDTWFMVLRKQFEGLSFLHLYLRVLNLCGWFVACRFVCTGEAYVPALISSLCQAFVYGLYFCLGVMPTQQWGSRWLMAARISEVQIVQYVTCAIHSILAAALGNFPSYLAVLHLLVIGNGLVLYTDFHSKEPTDGTGAFKNVDSVSAVLGPAAAPAAGGGTDRRPKDKEPRVTFSFDSSGWLMVYHFGVAAWLSEHLGLERSSWKSPEEPPKGSAFSGSSGGSLVSCVLATGTKVSDVLEFILQQHGDCRKDPRQMFPAVEKALRTFQRPGDHGRVDGRLRVLLTRVRLRPPFVMGEFADRFPDNDTAIQLLCASCHVPLAAGLRPRRVGDRYYYDGLAWSHFLLVPWRAAPGDHVVRVSASGAPFSDVSLAIKGGPGPFWWGLVAPSVRTLRGLYWCGYRDAARWFAEEPKPMTSSCGCRRPGDAVDDALGGRPRRGGRDEEEDDAARWRAARALLVRAPQGLPELDPVTGERVQDLIESAEASAERERWLSSRLFAALLVCLVAVCWMWVFR